MKTTARSLLFSTAGFGLFAATAFLAETLGPAANLSALFISCLTALALAGVAAIDLTRPAISSGFEAAGREPSARPFTAPSRKYVRIPALIEFAQNRSGERAA